MVNPYEKHPMVMASHMHQMDVKREELVLIPKDENGWICVKGVDFGEEGAVQCLFEVAKPSESGRVVVSIDTLIGTGVGSAALSKTEGVEIAFAEKIKGVHDLFFVFEGKDFEMKNWMFR